MRTTIKIDDELLLEAKTRAAMTGRTLNQVVEDALRAALARREPGASGRVPLPVFHSRGVHAGVDLDDTASLLDLMEGGR